MHESIIARQRYRHDVRFRGRRAAAAGVDAAAATVATRTHTPTRRHGHDASIQRYIFKYECLNFDNISKFLFRGILTRPRRRTALALERWRR